jgi:hypothetical protein
MKAVRIAVVLLLSLVLSTPVFASGGRSGKAHHSQTTSRLEKVILVGKSRRSVMKAGADRRTRAGTTRTRRLGITIETAKAEHDKHSRLFRWQ